MVSSIALKYIEEEFSKHFGVAVFASGGPFNIVHLDFLTLLASEKCEEVYSFIRKTCGENIESEHRDDGNHRFTFDYTRAEKTEDMQLLLDAIKVHGGTVKVGGKQLMRDGGTWLVRSWLGHKGWKTFYDGESLEYAIKELIKD